jgi:hypothetical protein
MSVNVHPFPAGEAGKVAMNTPPISPSGGASLFDPSLPFKGVVVCCTSIPPEQRVG